MLHLEKQMDLCIRQCCVALQEGELFYIPIFHKKKLKKKKKKTIMQKRPFIA